MWLPLACFEQRCQQIGLVMAYILYTRDRIPGTLLDQTPTKERKRRGGRAVKTQRRPLAWHITLAKESIPNMGLTYLLVGQPSVGLVWFSVSQARPIV